MQKNARSIHFRCTLQLCRIAKRTCKQLWEWIESALFCMCGRGLGLEDPIRNALLLTPSPTNRKPTLQSKREARLPPPPLMLFFCTKEHSKCLESSTFSLKLFGTIISPQVSAISSSSWMHEAGYSWAPEPPRCRRRWRTNVAIHALFLVLPEEGIATWLASQREAVAVSDLETGCPSAEKVTLLAKLKWKGMVCLFVGRRAPARIAARA
uniref:Uncharacterized protein n=1 Tax=Sphaerodactylus townsendi TaxID=933632 RepID=A0ACB8EE77_9SAUR